MDSTCEMSLLMRCFCGWLQVNLCLSRTISDFQICGYDKNKILTSRAKTIRVGLIYSRSSIAVTLPTVTWINI